MTGTYRTDQLNGFVVWFIDDNKMERKFCVENEESLKDFIVQLRQILTPDSLDDAIEALQYDKK